MVSVLPATPEAFIDHWTRAEANERCQGQACLELSISTIFCHIASLGTPA